MFSRLQMRAICEMTNTGKPATTWVAAPGLEAYPGASYQNQSPCS